MPLQPRERDLPRIPAALTFYKISSIVTGTLLLLLCAEMVMKYAFGLELELGGAYGFLAFVPSDSLQAINLSLGILMVHGWGYVVYLFADFRIWSLMRWPFSRFLLIALGGIIPFLSFFLEVRIVREVKAYLASHAASGDLTPESVEASH
jgi:integral membrane protein